MAMCGMKYTRFLPGKEGEHGAGCGWGSGDKGPAGPVVYLLFIKASELVDPRSAFAASVWWACCLYVSVFGIFCDSVTPSSLPS